MQPDADVPEKPEAAGEEAPCAQATWVNFTVSISYLKILHFADVAGLATTLQDHLIMFLDKNQYKNDFHRFKQSIAASSMRIGMPIYVRMPPYEMSYVSY